MRAELIEKVLTDLSRHRALTDEESYCLERAIGEQKDYRLHRNGRRYPTQRPSREEPRTPLGIVLGGKAG